MTLSSQAGGASPCSADTIPIQITDEMKRAYSPITTLSAVDMSDTDPHFRDFIAAVTKHVSAKLAKEKLCLDEGGEPKSLLHFVHWPLVVSDDRVLAVPSVDAPATAACRITSPWMDIAFERKRKPRIRAVVRWSERQLLADQAVLHGLRKLPPGSQMPFKQSEFLHFANSEYAASEIHREPATTPIETRVPPELLWLFRRSWQATLAPFSSAAVRAMVNAMAIRSEQHSRLVIALVDRCFATEGMETNYNSILDIEAPAVLEQYKINIPIR